MRRPPRLLGLVLASFGLAALVWTAVVWQWRDPFTSLYTAFEQRRLEARYDALAGEALLAGEKTGRLFQTARQYRRQAETGQPIGRLRVDRLGLDVVFLEGTDDGTLRRGPGRDSRSFMPGEGELVYLAGHRTTYLAPFARIEQLRKGDPIVLEVPYGLFHYAVTGRRIVRDDDLSVLRSPGVETLRLQACHPRFFATHRYVILARLVSVASDPHTRPHRRVRVS